MELESGSDGNGRDRGKQREEAQGKKKNQEATEKRAYHHEISRVVDGIPSRFHGQRTATRQSIRVNMLSRGSPFQFDTT